MMTRTFMLFLDKRIHIVWRDTTKEIDVFVRMELGHLTLGGGFGSLKDR